MRFKKELALFLFCIILCLSAFSQENFVQGYIVRTNGDTIRGEVDYRNWRINPGKVQFKKSGQAAAGTYTAKEIKSFYAAGDFYYGAVVEAEKSPRTTMNLDGNPEFIIAMDTTFLHALITGEKSLFHYIDADDRENFYIGNGAGFELLKYKVYLISSHGISKKQSRKHFVGQLMNYFSACEGFQKNAAKVQYTKKSLLKAFEQCYVPKSEGDSYIQQDTKARLDVAMLGGASYAKLSRESLSASVDPVLGLSLNVVIPRNFEKWSLENNILLTRFAAEGSYSETHMGRYTRYDTDIELTSVKLYHLLRYTTRQQNIRYFGSAGFLHGYSFASRNETRVYSEFGPDSYTRKGPAFPSNEVSVGYAIGVGGVYDKCSLQLRYESTKGIIAFNSRSLLLLFGYRLSK